MAIFLRVLFIDLFDYLTDGREDCLIVKDFLGRVHEQDVHSVLAHQKMLLLSPCFPDASLAQVSLHSSLEDLLRHGYKNPGVLTSGVLADQISHARNIPVFTLRKKLTDERLAAESFVLLKCI